MRQMLEKQTAQIMALTKILGGVELGAPAVDKEKY